MVSAANNDMRERAPLLLVFGSLADRVAALLRTQPSLVPRLVFAPRAAVHATAAFLYLAPEAAGSVEEIADLIARSDPRNLLQRAMPGCPPELYRALDRAGNVVRTHAFYERVGRICRGPLCLMLLDGELNDVRSSFYETIQTMDPLVVSLHRVFSENLDLTSAVDTLIVFLRSHDAIGECDLQLPKNAGVRALLRRLLKAFDTVRAPIPPFVVPVSLRRVETVGELPQIGQQFENCLASLEHFGGSHLFQLAHGSTVFLLADEPPLLIALDKVGPDLWRIAQIAGPKNAGPARDVRESIESSLTATGLTLVSMDPTNALMKLHRAARRNRGVPDDDLYGDDL